MTPPIRWVIRMRERWEPQMRGGSIVYGGRASKVKESYRVLQYWDAEAGEWKDVPEVRDP